MYYVAKRESQPFTQNCQQGTEKTPKALVNLLLVTSLPLLAMLVALHFTPVSHSVIWSEFQIVVVSRLASSLLCHSLSPCRRSYSELF